MEDEIEPRRNAFLAVMVRVAALDYASGLYNLRGLIGGYRLSMRVGV